MQHGTSYHVYLEAIFDKNLAGQRTYILKTWILIVATRGIGPDNRMFQLMFEYYLIPYILQGCKFVTDFGSVFDKFRIRPFFGNPAKSGSGQIFSRIWQMLV